MKLFYILVLVLSAFRLTEMFWEDDEGRGERITQRLRMKFPLYIWKCTMCLSVWAGIAATVLFYFAPFVNIPLAVSLLFSNYSMLQKFLKGRLERKVSIIVDSAGGITINRQYVTMMELRPLITETLKRMENEDHSPAAEVRSLQQAEQRRQQARAAK